MTLVEFDAALARVAVLDEHGRKLVDAANELELATLNAAGVFAVVRDPGLPIWTASGINKFYDSARQVVEALEKGAT